MTLPASVLTSKDRWRNSFVGFFSKDIDPPSQTYPGNSSKVLDLDGTIKGDVDSVTTIGTIGGDAIFIPVRVHIPTLPTGDVRVRVGAANSAAAWSEQSSTLSASNDVFQDCIDRWLGGGGEPASDDGEGPTDVEIVVDEQSGTDTTTDIGTIRIRGMVFLRGSGAAP